MNEMNGRLIINTQLANYRNYAASNQYNEDIHLPSQSTSNCMQVDADRLQRKYSDTIPDRLLLKNCSNPVIKVNKFKIISPDEGKIHKEFSTDNTNNNTVTTCANSVFKKDKIISKLTFGNAFSLSSKHLMNASPIKTIKIDRNGLKTTPSPGLNLMNINQTPILDTNKPQINININNLNINNFNLCSKNLKMKKSLESGSIFPHVNSSQPANNNPGNIISFNQNNQILIKNIDFNTFKLLPSALTPQKFADVWTNCYKQKESTPIKMKKAREELKTRGSNVISKESDELISNPHPVHGPSTLVGPNTVKQTTNEIETILEGNNDSFINELADLLKNVDDKANKEQEEMEKVDEVPGSKEKISCENQIEETPDPRINFEQLQILNSKRPQTSYGGLSARQRSLQNSLLQKSSKISDRMEFGAFPIK